MPRVGLYRGLPVHVRPQLVAADAADGLHGKHPFSGYDTPTFNRLTADIELASELGRAARALDGLGCDLVHGLD